jgi:multidrug efflux pump subunit AcrB
MDTRYTRAARRELGFVLSVAVLGIALVLVVAFAPWYDPVVIG